MAQPRVQFKLSRKQATLPPGHLAMSVGLCRWAQPAAGFTKQCAGQLFSLALQRGTRWQFSRASSASSLSEGLTSLEGCTATQTAWCALLCCWAQLTVHTEQQAPQDKVLDIYRALLCSVCLMAQPAKPNLAAGWPICYTLHPGHCAMDALLCCLAGPAAARRRCCLAGLCGWWFSRASCASCPGSRVYCIPGGMCWSFCCAAGHSLQLPTRCSRLWRAVCWSHTLAPCSACWLSKAFSTSCPGSRAYCFLTALY